MTWRQFEEMKLDRTRHFAEYMVVAALLFAFWPVTVQMAFRDYMEGKL